MVQDNNSIWDRFTNMYPVSKTLRFELRPIGKTLEFIKEKGLIEEDKERDKEFKKVKTIMDDYYREFIEKCLSRIKVDIKDLKAYRNVYEKLKNDKNNLVLKEQYAKNQIILRKEIFKKINEQKEFKDLFGKKFLDFILPNWLEEQNRQKDRELVLEFKGWTTYFTGFFENRKNVFSSDNKSTSIINRIVNDNLPKYLDNISKYEKLIRLEGLDYSEIETRFKEELGGVKFDAFFSEDNFNNCLNQTGIDKFNLIIGGKTKENNDKIQGLNEFINEFSQKIDDKTKQKVIRKLKMSPLFKQILSDRKSLSFVLEKIHTKLELFEEIDKYYGGNGDLIGFEKIILKLTCAIEKLKDCDLDNVYIKNDNLLTQISKDMFGDWNQINEGLRIYYIGLKANEEHNKTKIDKEVNKLMKSKYFSLKDIENSINSLDSDNKKTIIEYFTSFKKHNDEDLDLFADIKAKYSDYSKIDKISENKLTEKSSELDVEKIKVFLDSIMNLYHFVKPLHLNFKNDEKKSDALETDSHFYIDFNEAFEELGFIVPLYNKVRNYVTQKPFSTKKFKLNFNNSTLANGWDMNKEKDNFTVLFRKRNPNKNNYDYYLGIMSGVDKKIFEKVPKNNSDDDYYEKIVYKLLPGPEKMLPKVFFSKKSISFFNPSKDILDIRNRASHTKNGNPQNGFQKRDFNLNDCHKMIDFYKLSLGKHDDWSTFNFIFKDTNQYNDLSDFYADVSNQGYKISYFNIPEEYLNALVEDGKLYLFQIWNKDFSEYSKGKPNLHTIYWRELFSENNLKDVVYKLNGEAELFYREASIKRNITHPKNQKIENKNPINNKNESKFGYDIIKDRRYTKDKFFFHCPITLNFKAKDQSKVINKLVNKFVYNTDKKINVLGIDRGERNLAYYTLVDSDGNIIEQNSFNIISDDLQRKLNYQERLDQIEGSRDKARKNWKKISNIKEMKTGYLSHVIHRITDLAIKNNAIIVLEDLNYGFKRGRFKIEKQIYQKFEKMLIDKLNYLVFKNKKGFVAGGVLNAFQLTNKFESFQKLGKQSGIIYYVDAYLTSKICPKTGFANLLYPKFVNIKKSQDYFKKFKYIKYNKNENLFEFNFDYSDFNSKDNEMLKRNNWSIWSNGDKLIQRRNADKNNSWETLKVDVTKELQKLFDEHNIDYKSEENLIENITNKNDKDFFESLMKNIKLILQLRNYYSDYELKQFKNELKDQFNESNYDYILSCVKDKQGKFFNSQNASKNEVKDADANGAYHIALKGLMLIDKIKNTVLSKRPDLKINRNDYLNYVIGRNN